MSEFIQDQFVQWGRGMKHAVDVVAIAGFPIALIDTKQLAWWYMLGSVVWIFFRLYEMKTTKHIIATLRRWAGI